MTTVSAVLMDQWQTGSGTTTCARVTCAAAHDLVYLVHVVLEYLSHWAVSCASSAAGKGAMAEVSTIVNVVKQYLPTTDQ